MARNVQSAGKQRRNLRRLPKKGSRRITEAARKVQIDTSEEKNDWLIMDALMWSIPVE